MPVSGFFLDHDDVTGTPQYATALKTAFDFHNASAGVSSQCLAAPPPTLEEEEESSSADLRTHTTGARTNGAPPPSSSSSRCFFAESALPHIVSTPVFVLNSALDQFQTLCILTGTVKSSGCSAIPGWEACRRNLTECTESQMSVMVQYEKDFLRTFAASFVASASGNGAFLYSCHNHCAGDSDLYNRIAVADQTMMQKVEGWWHRTSASASSSNASLWEAGERYGYATPCLWNTADGHRKCNPTCYKDT